MSFEIPTLFSCGRENSTFVKYTVTRHQNFSKRGLTEEKIAMNFLSHCLSPNVKVNMAYYFKSSFLLCDILTTSLLRFLSRFYELSWKMYILYYIAPLKCSVSCETWKENHECMIFFFGLTLQNIDAIFFCVFWH